MHYIVFFIAAAVMLAAAKQDYYDTQVFRPYCRNMSYIVNTTDGGHTYRHGFFCDSVARSVGRVVAFKWKELPQESERSEGRVGSPGPTGSW